MVENSKKPSTFATAPPGPTVAGLHLSGPNTPKTALCVGHGDPLSKPLNISKVYEKIGSFGSLFSDERVIDILVHEGPFETVFVDCPLTAPPCVACQRPSCPGAMQCDDVSVAYMLSVSAKIRARGARKSRPVNPQSQRLCDILQWPDPKDPARERPEPSYSANLAPLVARSSTLQRRLNALSPRIVLHETHVPGALAAVSAALGLQPTIRQTYRHFEKGQGVRRQIVETMLAKGWIAPLPEEAEGDLASIRRLTGGVEVFHAFLTTCVAAWHAAGLTTRRPENFIPGEGWVHLPQITGVIDLPTPVFDS